MAIFMFAVSFLGYGGKDTYCQFVVARARVCNHLGDKVRTICTQEDWDAILWLVEEIASHLAGHVHPDPESARHLKLCTKNQQKIP